MTDPGTTDGAVDPTTFVAADGGTQPDGPDEHREPLERALRWLRTVPVTLALCLLLCWVYVLELAVLVVADRATATWWFVARPSPSPGWLLAPLSHTPADPAHLLSNLALLVVYGGMTERRLGGRRTLAVLAVAGLGGTGGQLLSYALAGEAGGTLGASGMALAATAFGTVAAVRERLAGRWAGETTWVWAAFGAVVVGRRVALDLVVGVPGVGRFGHLWGIVFGVALALVWPTASE